MQPKEVRKILDRQGVSYDPNALRADTKDQALRSKLYKKAQMLKAGQGRQDDQKQYPGGAFKTVPGQVGAFVLRPEKGSDGGFSLSGADIPFDLNGQDAALKGGSSFKTYFPDRADLKENQMIANLVTEGAETALKLGVLSIGERALNFLEIPGGINPTNQGGLEAGANKLAADADGALRTMEGFIFEGLVQGITGAELAGEGASFDFPNVKGGSAKKLEAMFAGSGGAGIDQLIKADAKRGVEAAMGRGEGSLAQKTISDIKAGNLQGVRDVSQGKILTEKQIDSAIGKKKGPLAQVPKPSKKAAGGKIDSVPALLTPGEYVVNKSSAQSIGYSNLNKMNQTGVQKFAKGGAVGFKRFATGGPTGAGLGLNVGAGLDFGGVVADINNVNKAFQKIGVTGDKLRSVMVGVSTSFANGLGPAGAFDIALEEIRNSSQAAAAAATAAAAVPTGGDLAVQDAEQFQVGGDQRVGGLVQDAVSGGKKGEGDKGSQSVLAQVQKQEIAAITKAIRASDSSVTMSEAKTRAEGVVAQKYGILAKEAGFSIIETKTLSERRKELADKLKESIKAAKKSAKAAIKDPVGAGKKVIKGGLGLAKKGLGKVGAAAKNAQGLAQSAQQAVFFGSAILATAVQMSNMSDVTKQAATETVAFGAALVAGASTAVDMLANFASVGKVAAAAETAETTANAASTTSEIGETVADTGEAVASAAVSLPLLILVGVVFAVILALKYFSAQAKAEADALSKKREESLDRLGEGEGAAGDVQSAKDSIDAEFALRQKSNNISPTGGGAGTVAASAAAGALIGSFIPGIGTFVGAVIGAGVGLYLMSDASAASAEASRKQTESIYGSIDAIAKLGSAGKKFDETMSDLGKLPAATTDAGKEDRIQQELAAENELGTEIKGSNVGDEFGKLADLATKKGKTTASLTEKDFDEEDEQGAKDLAEFQAATRAGTLGLEQLAKRTSATRKTLQKAADLEIDGSQTFAELKASGGVFAQALEATKKAIMAEAEVRGRIAREEQDAARRRIAVAQANFDVGGGTEDQQKSIDEAKKELKQSQDDEKKINDRATKSVDDVDKAYEDQVIAAGESAAADRRAAAAAEALRRSLLETSKFMMALSSIEFAQQEQAKGLSNQAALQSGGDLDFSRTGAEGLDGDVTKIPDINKFSDEVSAGIQDLPPALRAQAQKQLEKVQKTSEVFSSGKENVLKATQGGTKDQVFGREQQLKIIEAAGLNPDDIDDDILEEMLEKIKDAAVNGIDEGEFEDIFDGIKAEGEAAQGALQEINDLRNNEIDNYGSYLDNVQSKWDEQLEGIQDYTGVVRSNAELLAKARGGEQSLAAKQNARVAAAGTALSGTGVKANDVGAAAAALKAAKQRRKAIAEEIKDRSASVQSIKQKMQEDKRLQDVIKKTTAELDRLGNQSELAGDILGEIDKEKSKRETVTGLITDFVVGGQDQRKGMIDANNGIVKAVQTGTLQNQTEEERSNTVGLLDKLADIAIPSAGGLTGKEVKQELVFRDAIRMGLDPDVARQLSTATTKEEDLIIALENLTAQMQNAAGAQVVAGAGLASGGLVQYRADGGSIFQPRGTDTVPAMLTPGEFVIKKSSVDKIGRGNLAALNNGYARGGLVQYRQGGGGINALNAGFGGGGGNPDFKVPNGDQIKSLFYQSVRNDFGGFLKELREVGYTKNVTRRLVQLKTANRLKVKDLKTPDRLAQFFDTFVNSSNLFSSADADGVSLKIPAGLEPLFSGQKIDYKIVQGLLPQLETYATQMQVLGQIPNEQGRADSNAVGRLINQQFGFDPAQRAAKVVGAANFRGGIFQKQATAYENILLRINKEIKNTGKLPEGDARLVKAFTFGSSSLVNEEEMDDARKNDRIQPNKKPRESDRLKQIKAFLQENGVLRLAQGGGVPGTDTVPAMLTPGEFVMNKAAVAQHGVGYMKSLNRGRIPGFNRGGVVGRGGVQYKKEGGSIGGGDGALSIDPRPLQNVLTTFNINFSLTLDKITGPFKNISLALLEVAKSFERVEFRHEFRGDIGLSVNISNKDAIIAAVSEGIVPSISALIERSIDENEKKLRSGP